MADDSFFPDFNINYPTDYSFYTPEPEPFSTPEFSFSPSAEPEMSLPYSSSELLDFNSDSSSNFGLNEEATPYQNVLNAVSGYVGGAFTFQGKADTHANNEYYNAYNNSLENGLTGSHVFAMKEASAAKANAYADYGINPLDIFGTNESKAYVFTRDYANSSIAGNIPSPDLILQRIINGEGPGDYLARVTSKDPLNKYPDPLISGGDTAWLGPLDEMIGQKLNEFSLQKQVGFTRSTILDTPDNSKLLTIYPAKAFEDLKLATWENAIIKLEKSGNYTEFLKNDPQLWDNLKEYDYVSDKRKAELLMTEKINYKAAAKLYGESLPEQHHKNLYKARALMDYGSNFNELYTGKGYTQDFDFKPGNREFITANRETSKVGPVGVIEFNNGTMIMRTVEDTPAVPNKVLSRKAAAQTGIGSALTSVFFAGNAAFDKYMEGELSGYDAITKTFKAGGIGAFVGVASAAAEKWVTETSLLKKLDNAKFLKDMPGISGQALRQYGGSIGIGSLVSTGFAAIEQGYKWMNGEVSTDRAVGNVVAESTIGALSTAGGLAAGAAAVGGATAMASWLGASAGTFALISNPLGLGLLAGAAGGYAVDRVFRANGWDRDISNIATYIYNNPADAAYTVYAGIGDAGISAIDQAYKIGAYTYNHPVDAAYTVYSGIGDAGISAIDYSIDLASDSYYATKDYSKRAWNWITD